MSQSLILDLKGEHTYASDLSGVPPGSLSLALNVSLDRTGVAEPRRGFSLLTYGLPVSTDRPNKLIFWNSEILAYYNSATLAYYDTGSGFSSRGSISIPSNANNIRYVSSQNKNLYLTSSTGLKKTDALATSVYTAGIPKGLTITLAVAGGGTALVDTKYATYQYLLGRKDANSNQAYGGVSGRFTLVNSAGSDQNVSAQCFLPAGLDDTYFIQLYRSQGASTAAATGEELQLCYEAPLTSTNVSDGYVTVTDITPDALLGATIYTAPSQQGAVNDNAVPPLARDIAEYKDCLFFGDVEGPQRLKFNLISVASPGLVLDDTITITLGATTEVYTAKSSTTVGSKYFTITTGGTASPNIDATIKSFIEVVNRGSAIVYAYSLTTGDRDLPGRVMIEARSTGTAIFTVTSSRSGAFQPTLPSPATINNTSSADQDKNAIMFSKPRQQEAVPLKNKFFVGAADDRIKRIVPLRDGLFIFKERDGAFVLRGDSEANFSVSVLDSTAKLTAPESLAVVNNLIYGLFESGICEVSDTGVSIISVPIKDQIQSLFGAPLTAVKAYSFGIANENDGKYILCVPEASTDTYATKQIVFDTFGRTFTRWDLALTCGGTNPVDAKLYLGQGASNYIKQERKAFDYTDFADYSATCTITAESGTTLTIDNTSLMAAGDIIYQGSTALAYIVSVDTVTGTIVVDDDQTWTLNTADVTHVKAINCKIEWNADYAGNPAGMKQYYEAALLFKQNFQRAATVYFSSDINPSESSIAITSASGNGAFGQFTFGDEVFGGEQARAPNLIGIPRGHAQCSQLVVRYENKVAFSDFQLSGLSLSFIPTSTRVSR